MSIESEPHSSSVGVFVSRECEATHSTSAQADRVVVFARFPEAGQTKTRLIPALGPVRAAQLQTALIRRTLDVARKICSARPCDLEVRFAGGDRSCMCGMFGADTQYVAQKGAGLGNRLEHAVTTAFLEGAKRVLVIGTDCPELEPPILDEAFEALTHADVVLGPAIDGGYYLIGLRVNRPELFRGIDWGTEHVLRQTLQSARHARSSVRQLRPLSDVDYPEDLLACRRVPRAFSDVLPEMHPGLLSIVVPTFNEERTIEQTLGAIAGLPDVEVIVADGGSTDATAEIARRVGVCVVPVRPGRGRQMNAGAALARGEVLLFLHADTKLPGGFREHVWSTLDRGAVAGAFPLRINDEHSGLRWIEWGANLRSHFLQMPYGDQGLFVRSELFHRVGGFPNWPLMEDYELCRRLRRHGRILLAPAAISTSARRWMKLGLWRTTFINQLCIAGFRLGVSPERLAHWYSSRSGRKR
jgi:rSAM/selenodomain-associated transferase 2/rSAM/selenodomain-associated transferase 1